MIRVIAFACAISLLASIGARAETPAEIEKAKAEIWDKELKIYAGRAKGDVTYYHDNASADFLAWTYGAPKPFRKDNLARARTTMKGQDHEKIDTTFKDFSLHGDTAVIYYVNHRTMLPNGTPVDQTFDNIHVWVREDGTWKVMGSMSRLAEPPKASP